MRLSVLANVLSACCPVCRRKVIRVALTELQFQIYNAVHTSDGMANVGQLQKITGQERRGLSIRLSRMEKAGLLYKHKGLDRRQVYYRAVY